MVDISKEGISAHKERMVGPSVRPQVGSLNHDTFSLIDAQAARIAELEAALATAREDALREAEKRAWSAFDKTENFYAVLSAINPKEQAQ